MVKWPSSEGKFTVRKFRIWPYSAARSRAYTVGQGERLIEVIRGECMLTDTSLSLACSSPSPSWCYHYRLTGDTCYQNWDFLTILSGRQIWSTQPLLRQTGLPASTVAKWVDRRHCPHNQYTRIAPQNWPPFRAVIKQGKTGLHCLWHSQYI